MKLEPAKKAKVDNVLLVASDGFPNNRKLPLLVYRGILHGNAEQLAGEFERLFETHGWGGSWRNGVYPYHHFHSNSHEVLGVAAGHGRIHFGGPGGSVLDVHCGDVAVLPAGTGHKRVEVSADFLVVGAYPDGQEYDELRGDPKEQAAAEKRIAAVPLPAADPVYGKQGPLFDHWR